MRYYNNNEYVNHWIFEDDDFVLNEDLLYEKSLIGSLDSQVKKAQKAVNKQLEQFESAVPILQKSYDALEAKLGENPFEQSIMSFSANDLKRVAKLKAKAEVLVGIETVRKELERAAEILDDPFYIGFCKKIDDNTGLFGGDRGGLSIKGEDGESKGLTSKTAGKVVDKNKKGNFNGKKAHQAASKKEEQVLQELFGKKKDKKPAKDVTEDFEKFKKLSDELSQCMANAGQVIELINDDSDMQAVVKDAGVAIDKSLGALAVTGAVLKAASAAGIPGVGLVGTALASGTFLVKSGKKLSKVFTDPNLSFGQKLLKAAPTVAFASFAALGLKNAVSGLTVDDSEDLSSDDQDTDDELSDDDEDQDVDDDTSDTEDQTDEDENSNDDESDDTQGTLDDEEDLEPTIENTNEAVANAKPGDILQRENGELVRITQGDINYAKAEIANNADVADQPTDDMNYETEPVEDVSDSSTEDDYDEETSIEEEPDEVTDGDAEGKTDEQPDEKGSADKLSKNDEIKTSDEAKSPHVKGSVKTGGKHFEVKDFEDKLRPEVVGENFNQDPAVRIKLFDALKNKEATGPINYDLGDGNILASLQTDKGFGGVKIPEELTESNQFKKLLFSAYEEINGKPKVFDKRLSKIQEYLEKVELFNPNGTSIDLDSISPKYVVRALTQAICTNRETRFWGV